MIIAFVYVTKLYKFLYIEYLKGQTAPINIILVKQTHGANYTAVLGT